MKVSWRNYERCTRHVVLVTVACLWKDMMGCHGSSTGIPPHIDDRLSFPSVFVPFFVIELSYFDNLSMIFMNIHPFFRFLHFCPVYFAYLWNLSFAFLSQRDNPSWLWHLGWSLPRLASMIYIFINSCSRPFFVSSLHLSLSLQVQSDTSRWPWMCLSKTLSVVSCSCVRHRRTFLSQPLSASIEVLPN